MFGGQRLNLKEEYKMNKIIAVRQVKRIGSGSHITLPIKYLGKIVEVYVIE